MTRVKVHADRISPASTALLQRLDRLTDRLSDWVNPILVKESRQAVKSRQFAVTFAFVLVLAWVWSFLGVAIMSPGIFYAPGGRFMLVGYFVIMMIPLAIIVPFSAYRSLAGEREDGTFELLSISALRPMQVINGKLGSSALQILVYLSAISPCLAFTYLLRGVDLVVIFLILVAASLLSLLLSAIGLFLGAQTRQHRWQAVSSVALILLLAIICFLSCMFVSVMIIVNASLPYKQKEFWLALAAILTGWGALFAMVLLAASASISFASDNRSTRLRAGMLICHALLLGWAVWLWQYTEREAVAIGTVYLLPSAVFWWLMGGLMIGESTLLSPRVKRGLPKTLLERSLFMLFFPGPGTGYLFAASQMAVVGMLTALFMPFSSVNASTQKEILCTAVLCVAYVVGYLGIAAVLLRLMRRFDRSGPALGLAVSVLTVVFGCLIPLTIQFSIPRLMQYDYWILQASNVPWTLYESMDGSLSDFLRPGLRPGSGRHVVIVAVIAGCGIGLFAINLLLAAREIVAAREETPARVILDAKTPTSV